MKYEALEPISRDEATALFTRGEPEAVTRALLRVALHEPEPDWALDRWVRLASHPDTGVRQAVATSLGHLARVHRRIDRQRAWPVLRELAGDARLAGVVEDALDDIATFTGERVGGLTGTLLSAA